MLWLALYFPDLPLEVYTRGVPSDWLVISEGQGREQRVLRASRAAARLGVTAGMRVSAALALAGASRVMPRAIQDEQRALERLAAWARQYSSLVHVLAPHTLLLEVGGSLKLFGDLPSLLARIELGVAEIGYVLQIAVAPTPLAATWLARIGRDTRITDASRLTGVLAKLPLSVLELAPESLARLEGMGLRWIGDCLRLPRAGLTQRLGPELVLTLDRALGRVSDPRAPFVPPAYFESRLELPGMVENTQGVVFALNRLTTELCGDLRARAAGVMQLTLTLMHPHAPATVIELGLVAPTRDPKHLIELFRERLAPVKLPGPVEALVLHVATLLPLGTRHLDLFGAHPVPKESAAALIERLCARLGPQAVQGLAVVAEHRPERAYAHSSKTTSVFVTSGARPLWLLPEPVVLDARDDRPWLGGALFLDDEVERIESGWWDEDDVGRDYFVARNRAGECYWIFRELKPPRGWWLHGIFG